MARQLAAEGVTHIFGIPGVQLDYASNGLARYRDQITFINARHEQTTTYAADGYARTTGRIGVALVVPGPGGPQRRLRPGDGACLLVQGPVDQPARTPARNLGQELRAAARDPRPVRHSRDTCAATSTLVTDPGQVAGALHGAIVQLQNGPGPVAVELPPDILSGSTEGPAIGAEPAGTPSPGGPGRAGGRGRATAGRGRASR